MYDVAGNIGPRETAVQNIQLAEVEFTVFILFPSPRPSAGLGTNSAMTVSSIWFCGCFTVCRAKAQLFSGWKSHPATGRSSR